MVYKMVSVGLTPQEGLSKLRVPAKRLRMELSSYTQSKVPSLCSLGKVFDSFEMAVLGLDRQQYKGEFLPAKQFVDKFREEFRVQTTTLGHHHAERRSILIQLDQLSRRLYDILNPLPHKLVPNRGPSSVPPAEVQSSHTSDRIGFSSYYTTSEYTLQFPLSKTSEGANRLFSEVMGTPEIQDFFTRLHPPKVLGPTSMFSQRPALKKDVPTYWVAVDEASHKIRISLVRGAISQDSAVG